MEMSLCAYLTEEEDKKEGVAERVKSRRKGDRSERKENEERLRDREGKSEQQ